MDLDDTGAQAVPKSSSGNDKILSARCDVSLTGKSRLNRGVNDRKLFFPYLTPFRSRTFSRSITLSPNRTRNTVRLGHISVG
jgi:hypothetical protein